ncbi:hypothetical protein LTR91_008623 [Friedmanniomyces endolithicus]|uniref:DNA mismatch repair protein S5 domain-containing protein n=1 Tax=Friedmanniomyces endolithicus TaxID=329885 RepID=A0AAN6KML0_9PEZI|nr:hypothetical protein LTR94_000091 [Friedmanniomyces endolithicus]KAK0805992.1 hypothetical protein LTR59_003810 [Friedmanniomyces endolithicus]KAK0816187.1 hypothetical protein LTR38_002169 [Friedmanniomyces endolithicus]KAK0818948.1 hypothetical protein LTR75_002404 [Friedmanniomyces endolithicus]KAK0874006.1 hypothetical protein LTS02_000387 [Friedmanniomyces endolithicus]
MAIEKLADGAIATLGAYQTLTDPAALVKELIDNALDANATSIAIEISSNTLDVIQLRDNGHGIAPDDRAMVARPNCTSKLHNFDDLKEVGGSTLGFRGQALASAAEMSGTLTISTRVEGEEVAAALKISQLGEVVGRERASLPVGTTVRVTDFIKSTPVRRQRTLKDAERCLKHVNQTLQAYAFARPQVRYSLRVLKVKSEKSNYMYAPKPGGSVVDAALKIVGSACVSQCIWSIIEDKGFTLQAFVPRPDGDASKVGNIGTFLAVDRRPVSAARGTLKQLVKIFRDALKKSNASFGGVKDPFMYLSIICPFASYDPNVEPAKNDVLFADADTVVELARQLFAGVYQPIEVSEVTTSQQPRDQVSGLMSHQAVSENDDDFVTSLEPQRTMRLAVGLDAFGGNNTPIPAGTNVQSDPTGAGEPLQRPSFRSNLYGSDDEDIELMDARPATRRTEADLEELREARKDITVSNPWVMAKMNTLLRHPGAAEAEDFDDTNVHGIEPLPVAAQSNSSVHARQDCYDPVAIQGLPTPRPSSPPQAAPDFHPSNHVPDFRLARDGRMIGSHTLPAPLCFSSARSPESSDAVADWLQDQAVARKPLAYDISLAGQTQASPVGTPLHAIPEVSRRSPPKRIAQTSFNRPFVSPLVDGPPKEKVWFDHLDRSSSRKDSKWQHRQREDDGSLVRQGELGDLMDDPRPLTPPRRNRDIRNYVALVDPTAVDSASSFVERRNYAHERPASRSHSIEGIESAGQATGFISARGFMPASELMATEDAFSSPEKTTARPAKRRATRERNVLRELSANVPTTVQPDDDDGDQAPVGSPPPSRSRPASRRRRTTDNSTGKVRRRKSSRLPLERIPKGQGLHDVEATLMTSVSEVSRLAGKMDEEATFLEWTQPAVDAYDAFAITPNTMEVEVMAERLRELLVNHVPDGEMVQDLTKLVRDSVSARDVQLVGTDDVPVS